MNDIDRMRFESLQDSYDSLKQQLAEARRENETLRLAYDKQHELMQRENKELRAKYEKLSKLNLAQHEMYEKDNNTLHDELAALKAQSTPASVWLWRNKTTFCFFATKELAMQMNSGGASTWVEPVEVPVIGNTVLKESTEPVAVIQRNESGWITMRAPDGNHFYMSKYVGATLYTTPPTATALLESLGDWVHERMQQADADYHDHGDDTAEVYATLKMVLSKIESMMIESLPVIKGEKE